MRHLLVANRGEIAVRVLRTARALGYQTTAVYSDVDEEAPHVSMADHAVRIGPAPVTASYLRIDSLIAAARTTGADAIHPGYGMLSENADFARACRAAGLTFVGPSPEVIAQMGDKGAARLAAEAAGVPCVPGANSDDQSPAALEVAARKVGFPLMVKAAAGGGGRGMRRVNDPSGLAEAIRDASTEAASAFGDGRLLLERAIDNARHVEVQVIGDSHGHVIHLGERDCSVQRRFQKVLEEAPSPVVDAEARERLGEAAVRLAKACHYQGAGTVEFLYGEGGSFYFLEMNTRLQVEHPVTECVTGLDLVALQLKVASGEPLGLSQGDIVWTGHAIEARLCTEDPNQGFMPQTGTVTKLRLPEPPLARVDHGLVEGNTISPHYDSMVAKVITHGATRRDALRKLDRALAQVQLLGIANNRDFLRRTLGHPTFAEGKATTNFLTHHGPQLQADAAPDDTMWAMAALALAQREALSSGGAPRAEPSAFTNEPALSHLVHVAVGGDTRVLCVTHVQRPAHVMVVGEGMAVRFSGVRVGPGQLRVELETGQMTAEVAFDGDRMYLSSEAGSIACNDVTYEPADARTAAGDGRIISTMAGAVVRVQVAVADQVSAGDTLLVLEAMKLQHQVVADLDAEVTAVHVAEGDQVGVGTLMIELDGE